MDDSISKLPVQIHANLGLYYLNLPLLHLQTWQLLLLLLYPIHKLAQILGRYLLHLMQFDLSPQNRTMTTMRFPDNVTQWRFQHEEETLQRRTDH